MTDLEAQFLKKLRALPADEQRTVLNFIEFLSTRTSADYTGIPALFSEVRYTRDPQQGESLAPGMGTGNRLQANVFNSYITSPLQTELREKAQILSTEKQRELLDYVEFLAGRASMSSKINEPLQGTNELFQENEASFAQAAQKYIGVAEGPEDLSTNPDHMAGYGN